MNCDEVHAHLSEYPEKSLDPGAIKDAEDHLASCPRCRAEAKSLADCVRHVATLPQVDPPPGFAQRVLARVREIERKPSLWERLLFPLRVKIPIHATAVLLISILAVYLLEKESPRKQAQPPGEPAFGVLEKKEQAGTSGARQKLDATAQKKEKASSNEIVSREMQAPASELKPKAADQVVQHQGRLEESNALQDQRVAESKHAAEPPSTTAPRKSTPGAEEAAGAGVKSSAEELHAGGSAGTIPPELKKRSAATTASSAPSSTDTVSGSQSESATAASRLQRSETVPDVDLVVRRAGLSGKQRKDSLAALDKSAESEAARRQEYARSGQLLPAIPESAKPQDVWLTIPPAQYNQLKRELLDLGSIESESWLSSREKDAAFRAGDQIRIKVTVLPPEPESRSRVLPSDR